MKTKHIFRRTAVCGMLLFLSCGLLPSEARAQKVQVTSAEEGKLTLRLEVSSLDVDTVRLDGHLFSRLVIPGFVQGGEVGQPALPARVELVEVPLGGDVVCRVRQAQIDTLQLLPRSVARPVAPRQMPVSKASQEAPLRFDTAVYSANAFVGDAWATVHKVGVARDRNIAEVVFAPVRYNPVTGQVALCRQIEIEVEVEHADMAATYAMKERYGSPLFAQAVPTLNTLTTKTLRADAPIRYLIVSHPMFRGQLESFISWKRRLGYLVDIVYTDDHEVGSTADSIAQYLQLQYDNATAERPAPTYLLLVGDVQQVPANESQCGRWYNEHITDLYYTTWTEGDYLPDCFVGRFSAQNLAHLSAQVDKTLLYEQYAFPDPTFLGTAILVSGVDQGRTGDYAYRFCDPTMDYAARHYFNVDNGFGTLHYYKNNTSFYPEGVVVTGSSKLSASATQLRSSYNAGVGIAMYSAHGDTNMWAQPRMSVPDVARMTNNDRPGVMIGNCCLSNKFDVWTCYGEALLRQTGNAGAVAYIGASDNTYWDEDFYWAVGLRSIVQNTSNFDYDSERKGMLDRLFHTHGEPQEDWYTTTGAMIYAGNMAVESSTSTLKRYYWEVYHVMGDPSLMPWLGEADVLQPQLQSVADGNSQVGSLQVKAVPGAYVALTHDEELLAAAFAGSDSVALLVSSALAQYDSLQVAVSGQGFQPAFATYYRTGQKVPEVASNYEVYPVPTTGAMKVSGADLVRVTVCNLMGERLLTLDMPETGVANLDMQSLPRGVYLLYVDKKDGSRESKKVLKN
ncbi:MAG: T9SS type A sorting domain-containing protein [Bacteroidales bacterium]|nr:T9SS type A sorting domain-containing protein [Bacteroidales bacterium]